MKLYEKIKKEHLFVFIVLLTALILFNSFDFGYTGFAVKDTKTCSEQGYSCCAQGTGKGVNYFSLDNTCSQGQSCWAYCESSYTNKNLISSYSVFTDVFDSVKNFFTKLFKPSVGLEPGFTLSVQKQGLGLVRSEDGININCGPTCSNDGYRNTPPYEEETLIATPFSGYVFSSWSGDVCNGSTNPQCDFMMNSDKTVTATFTQSSSTSTLIVILGGAGTVTGQGINCPGDCTQDYASGTSVQLTATAENGYTFAGWGGSGINCPGTGTCSLTMSSNRQVTATFTFASQIGTCSDTPQCNNLQPLNNCERYNVGVCEWFTDECLPTPEGCSAANNNQMACEYYDCTWTPSSSYGTLAITSTPSLANIYVNDISYGVTPLTLPFNPGTYRVKLIKQNYQDYVNNNVVINAGQITTLNPTLNPVSSLCGNGQIDSGEQCDGSNLGSNTCQTQGFTGGILTCNSNCQFDTSQCTGTVPDTTKPVVTLISPINNPTYNANTPVTFTCSATDNVALNRMELWITAPGLGFYMADNRVISGQPTTTTQTFSQLFSNIGNYAWTCRAYDTSNNYKDGNINGLSAGFKIQSTTTCTPGSLQSGTQCLVCNAQGNAYVQDNSRCSAGQTCNSAGQCVIQTTPDIIKPAVNLISPINNPTYNANAPITFSCSATDNVALSKIDLWITSPAGGFSLIESRIVSGASATATFTKSFTQNGNHAWTCRAYDTSNNYKDGNINGQSAGFKIQGATVSPEVCNDDIDNDNDGATDELDTDCNSGAYVRFGTSDANINTAISPTYFDSNTPAKFPWEDSEIDVRCRISQSGSSLSRAEDCIFAAVGTDLTACDLNDDDSSDQNVDYICNVGELGAKNISCNILKSCHAYPAANPIRQINYTTNVTKPTICRNVVGADKVEISNVDIDSSSYEIGDTIESTLTITNEQTSQNIDVTVSAQLYDLNKRKLIDSVNQTKTIQSNFESQDYDLNIVIPSVQESKFKMYYKVYEKDRDNRVCLEAKEDLEIEGTSSACEDLDNDGYDAEACGGDDCDDDDPTVSPREVEVCTDNIDNDCNNLADENDPSCILNQTVCISGNTRRCGGQGACAGTQTCVSGQWAQCTGTQLPAAELCTNNEDDDCDGLTDSNDDDCGYADSDNDGLLDSWEIENFGSVTLYNAKDDPDNDGFTNLEEYDANTNPNDKSSKPEGEKPSLFTIVLIAIGVIVVALVLVWLFALRPKKPKFEYKPSKPIIQQTSIKKPFFGKEMPKTSPILKEYIDSSLRKGYTREQIKKALSAKGWKDNEIEDAFKK